MAQRPQSATPPSEPILLLDACTVINLYACRHMPAILASLERPAGIVSRVHQETLYVRRGGSGEDAREHESVDLTEMVTNELLHLISPTEDELLTFIDLTLELGDGEAMTVAVALHRGYAVVTDDRIAIRVIAGRVPVYSSLEVIKGWIDREGLPPAAITAILVDLRQRGTYLPGRSHPLRSWWDQYMDQE